MVEAISYWWCYSVNQSCCFPGKERVKPWRESGPRFCGTLPPDGDGESKVDERKKFSPNILPMRAFSSFRLSSQVEQLARVERLEQELGREQDRLRAMLNHLTTSTSGSRVLTYTYDYAYTLAQPPHHLHKWCKGTLIIIMRCPHQILSLCSMLMLLRWEIAGLVQEEGRDLLRKVGSWLLDIKDNCDDDDCVDYYDCADDDDCDDDM